MNAIAPACFLGSIAISVALCSRDSPIADDGSILIKAGCAGMFMSLVVRNGLSMIRPETKNTVILKSNHWFLGTLLNLLAMGINSEIAPVVSFWTMGWQLGDITFTFLQQMED